MTGKYKVFYHGPCTDGVFAALSARLYFGDNEEEVDYISYDHRADKNKKSVLEDVSKGDTVFLLDFCPSSEQVLKLCATARYVIIIDHHKTSMEDIKTLRTLEEPPINLVTVLDMEKSGSLLSWEYFRSKNILLNQHHDVSKYQEKIQLVNDYDLFRFAIAGSEEFAACFKHLNLELDYKKNHFIFNQLLDLKTEALIILGAELLIKQKTEIACLLANPITIDISVGNEVYNGLAVSNNNHEIISSLGNKLAIASRGMKRHPFGAVFFMHDNVVRVSLRGVDGFDSSLLAKEYGGGGNPGASSFSVTKKVFSFMIHTMLL